MDRRLPSINCFIKRKEDEKGEDSATDLMDLSDIGLLGNNFSAMQPAQGNENLYFSRIKTSNNNNNNTLPDQVKNSNCYADSFVRDISESMKYSYQSYGDVYNRNEAIVCQEINIRQDKDGNWIKCLETNRGNGNHQEILQETSPGSSQYLARNLDNSGSFSHLKQMNAYEVNDVPNPFILNENENSRTISNTRFVRDKGHMRSDLDPPNFGDAINDAQDSSDRNTEGYNNLRMENDGEVTLRDISYRIGDANACMSVRNDLEYFRNFSPESQYVQTNIEYSRRDHEFTQICPSSHGVELNPTMYMNDSYDDSLSDCPPSHHRHVNNDFQFIKITDYMDHQTNADDSGTAFGYIKLHSDPFMYEDTQMHTDNTGAGQMTPAPSCASPSPRQVIINSHGRNLTMAHHDERIENRLSENKNVIDTGQAKNCNTAIAISIDENCFNKNVLNDRENHFLPDASILTFPSSLEKSNPDSPMSSSSSTTSSSNDGTCNELLDDLIQDLLNSKGKKKDSTYIALISRAIFSSPEKKMLLSDIYDYLSKTFKLDTLNPQAWRNSVRHNLSLNECFVKHKRVGKGRGHYWSIHPACVDDFAKGDFRRRQARRLAQRNTKGGSRRANMNSIDGVRHSL